MSASQFILLFLALITRISSDQTELTPNSPVEGSFNTTGEKTYRLPLTNNTNKNDLIVFVAPINDDNNYYDPDLFISLKNTNPSRYSFDYESQNIGSDLIMIPYEKIKDSDKIYISVVCNAMCKYRLITGFQTELELMFGNEFKFKSKGTNIFYFKIPNNTELNDIQVNVYSDNVAQLKMMVGKNKLPNENDKDNLKVLPNFMFGYSFGLDKNEMKIGDVYKIVVKSDESTDIVIKAKIKGEIIEMMGATADYGLIKRNDMECYSFEIGQNRKDENVIVTATIYAGKANLLFNPWKLPKNSADFSKSIDLDEVETLRISKFDRIDTTYSFGKIYFCISATLDTSYFFNVFFENDQESALFFNNLISGITQTGYISPRKLNSYNLQYSGYEKFPSVSVNVESGNLTLSLVICEGFKCVFRPDYYRDHQYNLIQAERISTKQIVTLTQTQNLCYKKELMKSKNCSIFAVLDCTGDEECKYNIAYSHQLSQIVLYENTPVYQIANERGNYFRLYVHNREFIGFVSIILTPISGAFTMKTTLSGLPNDENSYKSTISSQAGDDIIRYSKEELSNNNFINIAVKCDSSGYFAIYYIVKYEKDLFAPSFLLNGLIITDYYSITDTMYKIYSFSVDFEGKESDGIIVTLTPEVFKYKLYVFKDKESIKYDEKLQTFQNSIFSGDSQIFISTNDIFKTPKKNFYLAVSLIKDSKLVENSEKGKFSLGVVYKGESLILNDFIPNHLTLENSLTYQKYNYFHQNLNTTAYIMLEVFNGECILSADFNDFNDSSNANFKSKKQSKLQKIKISPQDFKECKSKIGCDVKIKVERGSDLVCEYTISSDSAGSLIKLQNGVVYTREILPEEQNLYETSFAKNQTGELNIHINEGDLTAKAQIIDGSGYSEILLLNKTHFGYQTQIDEKKSNKCRSICKLVVQINGDPYNSTRVENVYSISFSSEVTLIKLDYPYKSTLSQDNWKYFKFDFHHNISNLFISLMKDLQGDAEIFVNFGTVLPTHDNSSWRSASLYSSFVEIFENDLFFTKQGIKSMSGTYTIGIYAIKNTSFTLYVSTYSDRINLITNGLSSSCFTKVDNGSCYFKYESGIKLEDYHDIKLNDNLILFKADFIYGSGVIYVKEFDPNQPITDQLPNENNSIESSLKQNRRDTVILNYNSKYLGESKLKFVDFLILVKCEYECFFNLHGLTENRHSLGRVVESGKYYLFSINRIRPFLSFYNQKTGNPLEINVELLRGDNLTVFEGFKLKNEKDDTLVEKVSLNSGKYDMVSQIEPNEKCKNNIENCVETTLISSEVDSVVTYRLIEEEEIPVLKLNEPKTISLSPDQNIKRGYFQIFDNYDSVAVSFSPEKVSTKNIKSIKIYAKLKSILRKNIQNEIFNEAPSSKNYDYMSESSIIDQKVLLNLPCGVRAKDIPKYDNEVRIAIYSISIEVEFQNIKQSKSTKTKFTLNINPQLSKFSYFKLSENQELITQIKVESSILNIYDIKRKESDKNDLMIEVSECQGKIGFALSDKVISSPRIERIEHEMIEYFGRYRLIIKNPKDHYYIALQGIEGVLNENCAFNLTDIKSKTNCSYDISAKYMIKYKSVRPNEDTEYSLEKNGEIMVTIEKSDTIVLDWSKPISFRTNSQGQTIIENPESKYYVFTSKSPLDFQNMGSLCFLTKNPENFKNLTTNINTTRIESLERGVSYFINVLAIIEGGEVLVYAPIQVEMPNFPWFYIPLSFMIFITLIAIVFWIGQKYKRAKDRLEKEMLIKDLNSKPNLSITEMAAAKNNKYGSLNEEQEKKGNADISQTSNDELVKESDSEEEKSKKEKHTENLDVLQ